MCWDPIYPKSVSAKSIGGAPSNNLGLPIYAAWGLLVSIVSNLLYSRALLSKRANIPLSIIPSKDVRLP